MNNNFGNNGFGGGQQNGFQQQGQQQQGLQQQGGFQQNNGFKQNGGSAGMFIDTGAAPDAGRGTLPKGLYPVRITNAEYKENNNHTGWILALENTVIDGIYAGRKIFDNYNLQNANETAQNIAQSQYAKLCQSIFGNAQNRPNNPAHLIGGEYTIDYGPERKKKNANDAVYGAESSEPEEVRMQVNDRMPPSAYKPVTQQQQHQQQQPMNQQGFSQQQQGFAGQHNQGGQQQHPQNGFQQQGQQQHNQQQNGFQQQGQQQGFQGNDGSQGQQQGGFSGQQNGDVQQAQGQGQGGNGQSAGAAQNNQPANNATGNVNPFNNGGGNGFGGGFGNM